MFSEHTFQRETRFYHKYTFDFAKKREAVKYLTIRSSMDF